MGTNDQISKAYQKQLEDWIRKTKVLKADIAQLTSHFQFDDGLDASDPDDVRRVNLTAPGLSYLLKNRPSNRPGKYNLYALLGVLFALDVVSKTQIEEFLRQYGYDKDFPENLTWEKIWAVIEAEAVTLQTKFKPQPRAYRVLGSDAYSENRMVHVSSKRRLVWLVLLALVGILLFVVVAFYVLQPETVSNCETPVGWTPPQFIREEGFSSYFVNSESPRASILQNTVRSIGISKEGIWVGYVPTEGGFDGISYLDKTNSQWTHCGGLGLNARQNINDIEFLEDEIYVATDGHGIGILSNETWRVFSEDHGLPSNSVYSIYILDNEVFAATLNGLAIRNRQYWRDVYTDVDGLASSRIHSILDDSQGNRWFGHIDKGITRITPNGAFHTYFTDATGQNFVRGIAEDTQGGVWFATDGGGVLRFHNEEWASFTVASGDLTNYAVQDIEVDQFDRIWIATPDGAFYTPDYGYSWIQHTLTNTWAIELGCPECAYNENHIWYVLREGGLGHSQLPPFEAIVRIESVPERVTLQPGEQYIFEVTVRVLSQDLDVGDGLFNNQPEGSNLYDGYPRIPVERRVLMGETYTFSNKDNPIIAPDAPGIYSTSWRIWQNTRYVSEPIIIEFEVVGV